MKPRVVIGIDAAVKAGVPVEYRSLDGGVRIISDPAALEFEYYVISPGGTIRRVA